MPRATATSLSDRRHRPYHAVTSNRGKPCTGPIAVNATAPSLPATPASIRDRSIDAISARIAEELGFEVGMFAGSIASFTVLGAPDLIVLTLTEFAAQAYRINRAGKLPLMVDADHGYGNALNVMRTVQELETAGVAALMIEDTAAAPRVRREEADGDLDRGRRGQDARRAGRAGGQGAGDHRPHQCRRRSPASADGITRLKAYEAAGVDALFIAGGLTRHDLDSIAEEVKIPLMLGGGSGRPAGQGLPGQPRRADRAARAPAVLGGGEGDLRHAEGAARGDEAVGAARHRVARN